MEDRGQTTRALTLSDIDPKKVNALLPTTEIQQVSPFHALTVTLVHASANPQDGDVYKQGSTKVGTQWVDLLSPTKVLLEKFAKAAGMTWDPRQSGPVTPSVCAKCQASHQAAGKVSPCVGCPHEYDIAHRAVGAIQTPTGQYLVKDAVYELDFVSLEEEALLNELDKNAKRRPEEQTTEELLRIKVRKAMAQKRRHRRSLAETGAQDRVIRKLLSTKSTYTAAELAKPFGVPQISFSPDMSDPETRRMFVAAAAKAATDVFGHSNSMVNITPQEAGEAEATVNALRGEDPGTIPDTRPQPNEDDALADSDGGPLVVEGEYTEAGGADPAEGGENGPVLGRDYIMCENSDCPSPEIWRVEGMTCEQMTAQLKQTYGRVLCKKCRPRTGPRRQNQ